VQVGFIRTSSPTITLTCYSAADLIKLDELKEKLAGGAPRAVLHAPPRPPPLTTHVLDTSLGTPAQGLEISLEIKKDGKFVPLKSAITNSDGRLSESLIPDRTLRAAVYRISFDTGGYYAALGTKCFYPSASIVFEIASPDEHSHVPLVLSPYGYSTYRGS
jgi:5-hydroxyisourate hydrolase